MTHRIRFDIRKAGQRIAIVLGLLAAINVAFYLFYSRPAVNEYRTLLKSESGQDQLDDRRGQVETREAYLEALSQAEEDLKYLRRSVLSSREQRMVEVQEEVKAIADQFRIDYNAVNYNNEVLEEEELDRMQITVPLEGGYSALRRFLQAVEQSSKFLIVERVALAKGKQGGVMLQLNITLATYFNAPENEGRRGRRTRA
jgi:Tfp pilus assembly protein PilO